MQVTPILTIFYRKQKNDFKNYSDEELEALAGVVMFGIPGEKKISTADMLQKLELYKDIDAANLARKSL